MVGGHHWHICVYHLKTSALWSTHTYIWAAISSFRTQLFWLTNPYAWAGSSAKWQRSSHMPTTWRERLAAFWVGHGDLSFTLLQPCSISLLSTDQPCDFFFPIGCSASRGFMSLWPGTVHCFLSPVGLAKGQFLLLLTSDLNILPSPCYDTDNFLLILSLWLTYVPLACPSFNPI
jgi:hypothetical protein